MTSDIDRSHFCRYDTDERDFLVDINAFPNEVLPKPPHLISAEVLVLEGEFHIVRLARVFIKLRIGRSWESEGLGVASLRTLVTVISPLFLIPNTSAILPGIDALKVERQRYHMESSTHMLGSYAKRTYLQLRPNQIVVLPWDEKQEPRVRVIDGHSQ